MFKANATHNRSGSITYKHLYGTTYEFTVTTCTKTSSEADRPELVIQYGDGALDTIPRLEDEIEFLVGYDVQINYYKGVHTYTGASTYTISVEDPNRNAGVLNITNSVDKVFCIQTELVISPFIGSPNNSLLIEDCPCPKFGCVNEIFCFNLSAYDPDGDSLSYELIPCKGENCLDMIIPNVYQYPHDVAGGIISIDPVTGTVCWDSPGFMGIYNIAIRISEWRQGVYVGSVIQDMQFDIVACTHEAPEVELIPDTCIFAGDVLNIPVTATDAEDNVSLFATGSVFNLSDNPATFPPSSGFLTATSTFSWSPNCDNASNIPYSVLIHAEDDNSIQLTDLEPFTIKVNIRPVENVTVSPVGSSMEINWDSSPCAGSYNIYRSTDSSTYVSECCEPGTPGYMGYEYIGNTTSTNYTDNGTLIVGNKYCYLVTVVSENGVESCVSEQDCASLKFETPILTNVTIVSTDLSAGEDSVLWAYPKELNTVVFPGPYQYRLYRSQGYSGGTETLVYTSATYPNIDNPDTLFFDTGLNTEEFPYTYRVELFSDGDLVGSSITASSIYASTIPNDNQLEITWEDNTPWSNTLYEVYKEVPSGSGSFVLIGTTSNQSYVDDSLVNGATYCYKVKSIGGYSAPGIVNPIINWSQITCGSPYDFTPPCPPVIGINADCELEETYLNWSNPNNNCADDVTRYNLYFAPFEGDSLEFLVQLNSAIDTAYVHSGRGSVAGCYYVTALDSVQYNNESDPSNIVCIDNCDGYYELPNIFTPDNSSANDIFHPLLPYKFVEEIDLKIYNRWGDLVFETTDPMINWDGSDIISGKPLADGVYFYTITVYEIKLSGLVPKSFQGIIHISNSQY